MESRREKPFSTLQTVTVVQSVLRKLLKEIYFYLRIYGRTLSPLRTYFSKNAEWTNSITVVIIRNNNNIEKLMI